MSKIYFFLVLSSILGLSLSQNQKLNVDVLYESLCPDSLKFIREQLYPVWSELAPYVNIKFVPFGKSANVGGSQFVCQHGPKECLGNKVQSCALSGIQDQNAQVEYVHCFMNSFKKDRNDPELGQNCALSVGLDWNFVSQCFNSEQGVNLQLLAEQETARISPKFVPTILYNGQFNQQAQDDSQVNFRGVVCSFVSQAHPEACKAQQQVLALF